MPVETKAVDGRYYQAAQSGSLAERMVIAARNRLFAHFMATVCPTPEMRILDVGVSDVLTDAANMLEQSYPCPDRLAAVGLGQATAFRQAFPAIDYRQVEPGAPLPFADASFDVVTSNAVLEHVGSRAAQAAFVGELARVGRMVFLTVPHRFFPVEHHTAIPFLHWFDRSFVLACRASGKTEWADEGNLILMSSRRLRAVAAAGAPGRTARIQLCGLPMGPFSSNLSLVLT